MAKKQANRIETFSQQGKRNNLKTIKFQAQMSNCHGTISGGMF